MIPYSALPSVNAALNGTTTLLLIIGYCCIRRRWIPAHRACMVGAFIASALFLASYLTYHAHAGSVRFQGAGWIRPLYFTILISHTMLAVVIMPLALRTLYLAARGRFEAHQRIARWTLPLWLYVSVTGLVVYWLLYRCAWGR